MASEDIDNITVRYSMLHSLSASNLGDSLDQNICHTQAMQAQIAHAMSRRGTHFMSWAKWSGSSIARTGETIGQNNGRRNGTLRASISFILNAPPAGRGNEGPETGNWMLIGSGWETARDHGEDNKSLQSFQGNSSNFIMPTIPNRSHEGGSFQCNSGDCQHYARCCGMQNTTMASAPMVNRTSFWRYAGWGGKLHTRPPAKACEISGHDGRGCDIIYTP